MMKLVCPKARFIPYWNDLNETGA